MQKVRTFDEAIFLENITIISSLAIVEENRDIDAFLDASLHLYERVCPSIRNISVSHESDIQVRKQIASMHLMSEICQTCYLSKTWTFYVACLDVSEKRRHSI